MRIGGGRKIVFSRCGRDRGNACTLLGWLGAHVIQEVHVVLSILRICCKLANIIHWMNRPSTLNISKFEFEPLAVSNDLFCLHPQQEWMQPKCVWMEFRLRIHVYPVLRQLFYIATFIYPHALKRIWCHHSSSSHFDRIRLVSNYSVRLNWTDL